jgi:hypothetical protein
MPRLFWKDEQLLSWLRNLLKHQLRPLSHQSYYRLSTTPDTFKTLSYRVAPFHLLLVISPTWTRRHLACFIMLLTPDFFHELGPRIPYNFDAAISILGDFSFLVGLYARGPEMCSRLATHIKTLNLPIIQISSRLRSKP